MERPPLVVRLLGDLEVRCDDAPLVFPSSKKTRALLGFLVAARGPHRREKLCSLLWEGPDDPRAQLRWSLAKLRPILDAGGSVRLVADREHVRFEGDAAVDLWELAEAARDLDAVSVEDLKALEERTRGELMEGLDVPDAYRFQQWLAAERDRARSWRGLVLRELMVRLDGDAREALSYARSWVQAEPFADEAHAAVIRFLGALGRKREALAHYDGVRVLFEREIGAEISDELEEARRGLSSRPASAPPRPGARPAAAAAASGARAPRDATPFVGREDLLRDFEAWADSGPGPRTLLLVGEPGVGKTRALAELTSRFAARGEVAAGCAFLAERVRPYGALVDALRTLPKDAVPEPLRAELAALLPELGPAPASGDERRLFEAVEGLLASRAAARGRLLFSIDDAHWLDEATAGLLHYLSRSPLLNGVLFVLTARAGELAENVAAVRLVRALAPDGRLAERLLPPMGEEDVARLVAAAAPGADARRVFTESEGNPLVALEVAHALARGEEAASRSYEERLRDRFERLSPSARALLPWAAALGRTFSAETLAGASGLPAATLLAALQELSEKGLLRTAPHGFDFAHDLVRRAAYRQLAEPSRPLLHREIARALAARPDPDELLSAEVARHASLGGESELAARAAKAAGERCLRLFARKEAAELADLGLAAARALPPAARLPLELGLLGVHVGASERPPAELSERVSAIVAEAGDYPAVVARGFFLLAVLHYGRGELSGAESAVLRAAEASAGADARTRCFSLANAARCLVMLERDVPRARVQLAEARRISETAGVSNAELTMGIGFDAAFRGDEDEALLWFEEALGETRRAGDHWRECLCLLRLARLELERERPLAALERCRAFRTVVDKIGDGSERAICESLTALAERALGTPGAEDALEEALAALRIADSKVDLAFALDLAAEIDLGDRGGDPGPPDDARAARARRRAEEALAAAEAVGLASEEAIARSLLARLAARNGDLAGARRLLSDLENELEKEDVLSARACEAVARALDALREGPTWNDSSSRTLSTPP